MNYFSEIVELSLKFYKFLLLSTEATNTELINGIWSESTNTAQSSQACILM